MRLAILAVTACVFVQIAGADRMPVSGSFGMIGGTTDAFSFESLTLGDGWYTSGENVDFTNPMAAFSIFLDILRLEPLHGSHGLDLRFNRLPSAQTFTAAGDLHNLRFDDRFGAPVGNDAGPPPADADTAFLRATGLLASVPEPGSFTLLLTGFAGLVLWRIGKQLGGRKIVRSQPGWTK